MLLVPLNVSDCLDQVWCIFFNFWQIGEGFYPYIPPGMILGFLSFKNAQTAVDVFHLLLCWVLFCNRSFFSVNNSPWWKLLLCVFVFVNLMDCGVFYEFLGEIVVIEPEVVGLSTYAACLCDGLATSCVLFSFPVAVFVLLVVVWPGIAVIFW